MGFFKQVKDMKNMVHEAPGLIDQSNQLRANAEAMAAAQQASQQAAFAAAMPAASPSVVSTPTPTDGDFAPVAGVSVELYAEVSRSFAEVGYDQTRGHELAARKGIAPADWDAAVAGWNARMTSNPAVASRFNALYTGR
ncbi:hypothetical protein KSP35_20910 [Aquihabitans sp. G128]|uniref:hypothetical protein n=1 Tax=Aquihabitans sp. G128 TaxID=2849779 RepID=UPI001C242115|nr:hypothetical protein [Aquihabitans sp. G128]QXC60753.1 hypothetical protein KSP35_20910 [Aquihabitans sp. G128]